MRKTLIVLLCLTLSCLGCDFAKWRQQTQQKQNQATIQKLKKLGEEMHANPQNVISMDGETDSDGKADTQDAMP